VNERDYSAELRPETELERAFLRDPEFRIGLGWGVPRFGHPEGAIYRHIQEVNANIDRLPISQDCRRRLRIINFVHDTFKFKEDKSRPRDWSRHHAIFARDFLSRYVSDPALLTITELHDEAYYVWRLRHLYQQIDQAEARLQKLYERVGEHMQLYYLFFKCDTCTGDKNPAPLVWFEATFRGIEVVQFSQPDTLR
jgi:hypothetical protein